MNIDELKAELDLIKDEKYNLLKLVNHDIRSPFNRIFALLQLFEMESTNISDQQRAYIDSMYLSISSGLEMITNLRDMREIDAGFIEIDKAQFDLVNAIDKAIRSYSKQIEVKNLLVKTKLSINNAPIESDPYFVQRVIENVLSNAIKFSKADRQIVIRLNRKEKSYIIEIQDFGDGIKSEEEHLLYQKFEKLSSIATGGEGSLGLGLYNTVYFLEKLKGTIALKRNDQPGSSFIINLPMK